jgi:hypothetical protein
MTDLKAENKKLIDLCYAVHYIDLDALYEDFYKCGNIQPLFDPTKWIIDYDAIRLFGILIRAAIKFRKSIKNIPLIPRKPPLD